MYMIDLFGFFYELSHAYVLRGGAFTSNVHVNPIH